MQDPKEFILNKSLSPSQLMFHPAAGGMSWHIDQHLMLDAALKTNGDMEFQFEEHRKWEEKGMATLLKHIPLKNLSGAVGECLGANYCSLSSSDIRRNPHEAGSPDFLPYFTATEQWISTPTKTAYRQGGFDAKGCKVSDMKFMCVDASSHHDQTGTILVAAWTQHEGRPQIIGVFYTNALVAADWKIGSLPKNNGSKPTSSAQLLLTGLEKLRTGWILLHRSVLPPDRKKDVLKYNLNVLLEFRASLT